MGGGGTLRSASAGPRRWARLESVAKKYPLEPLARVRAQKVESAARDLGAAVRSREAAERRRVAAERERECAEQEARTVRDAERCAMERGELRVRDLVRADAWEARGQADRAALDRQVNQARAREGDAAETEQKARTALRERRVEEDVVGRDRVIWTERERKKADAKEEEAGAEAWRPRRA